MADLPKRIALVYDRINKWGGAEQVLLALHEIFPQAPLYTAVYNPGTAPWASVFPQIFTSFLQHFPLAKTHHEIYPWLTPMAFESFNFDRYEAVISVTSADAKGIITKPSTFHLCYCLTPTRYLWSHPAVPWPVSTYLKSWDTQASARPDSYLAISSTVKKRIKSFYGADSQVVYPPVAVEKFLIIKNLELKNKNYFLWVGRLVYHKLPEEMVALFNKLQQPLVMVGSGALESRLRRLASPHVKIVGSATPDQLVSYYHGAKALITLHEEDFGLIYVEAQAAGKPVLALNRGGVKDIVIPSQTGILSASLTDLAQSIINFDSYRFNPQLIVRNSMRFSKERFQKQFVKLFIGQWTKYKNISTS